MCVAKFKKTCFCDQLSPLPCFTFLHHQQLYRRLTQKYFVVDYVYKSIGMFLFPGVFCHGRRPVCKVDVLGLVVSVAHRELFSVYAGKRLLCYRYCKPVGLQ